ncbi:helix-turn-helix domain-containing protein [Allosaccharopolyspora coralli]|uniref:Helix-turn-helix domain-containing protein n=1 Tax=Allosaccharopolyspora coralli TaxID=2665642 RepID=A0A5Q3Q6M0_9PSEU|nr:helix-turn-helix domain-containing protein [Allosaccharopolyspora coralli]QGK70112.1 helix-turn-helix domain-containing protein [Allosaccharopolyspora coralli]
MTRRRHVVAVLVRPGVNTMELGLVHQLFAGAVSDGGEPLYEVVSCAPEPGTVSTSADFAVSVEHGPELLDRADTVVVLASYGAGEPENSGTLHPALQATVDRIGVRTRLASICTGAFVLAAAGLLDGKRATTHWHATDRFRSLFPAVSLDPDVLYVDEGRILTSAGEASGIDLCLHLIRTDHGAAVANRVARMMVVPPHRAGGQAQFIRRPVPEPRTSSTARARAWALERLEQPLSVGRLAAVESMSPRTFTRRFRDEVGTSAGQWLAQQRLERALDLLENTDRPVDRIATDAGFGTGTSLRQHMKAALGVSPRAYRRTFRGVETDQ